ncbi:MAG: phosphoglycerate kinase [Candidatus Magasanikbacteria bacterium]|nr:phosphoglycerate kinase [Candidatus Magasanikbacteria bacterium]
MKIRTIKQIHNLKNKRVLVRVDFNVPLEKGKVAEDARLIASLPTIEHLIKKGAKVILVSHLGRPEGFDKKLSLSPVAKRLENLMGRQVKLLKIERLKDYRNEVVDQISKMKNDEVVMLENIRFFPDEAKDENNFGKTLSGIADIFVLDGFAVVHRDSGSVTGVAKHLPSYAGLLLEKEIVGLSKAIEKPKKPFVLVLGGAKMETKLPVLKNLLSKADYVLIGGGIFNTYLWAKGCKVGKSLIDKEYKNEALKLLKNKKVILPVDFVVGKENGDKARVQDTSYKIQVTNNEAIYDIGPQTIRLYARYIKKAQTIVWNGAMGYFEQKPYDVGTLSIARLVASRSKGKAFGIIGGGETLQAMEKVKMMEFVDLVSTGGGAMLEFLSGQRLPGLKLLTK